MCATIQTRSKWVQPALRLQPAAGPIATAALLIAASVSTTPQSAGGTPAILDHPGIKSHITGADGDGSDRPRGVNASSIIDDGMVFDDAPSNIFAQMNLEELLGIRVTSIAGVSASWLGTPAALTVITNEDIRRSGHRSIPEALRLVPGLHVARMNSGGWSISSRGFSEEFTSNKLQVLMDGRRLYDAMFSNVFWDVQDYVIEDISRIEVIRGPGATLWGANAVNGVINITTKDASETHGLLLSGGGGSFEHGFGSVRYGASISDDAHFRVYTRYRNFGSMKDSQGGRRPDDWDMWQGGFRMDFGTPPDVALTFQGDIFHIPERGTRMDVPQPTGHFEFASEIGRDRWTGGNMLVRLHHETGPRSSWTLLGYYDRYDRAHTSGFTYVRDSYDLDFRHHVDLGDRHDVIWGVGIRHDRLQSTPNVVVSLTPQRRSLTTFSGFVQNTITIAPERVFAMVGTKLEKNDASGFEIQPSARIWWTPDDTQTLWAAVSRPVRTPSWIEQNMTVLRGYADTGILAGDSPSGDLVPLVVQGDPSVGSEKLLSAELGYRFQPNETLNLDISTFYNRYSELIDFADGALSNVASANSFGAEVAAYWRVADNWTLKGSYSYLELRPAMSFSADAWKGSSPRHQFQIHSRLDITSDIEFNAGLYFVDRLRSKRAGSYLRLDLGVTWRPAPNVELSIWGQNLLERCHQEFDASIFMDSPAQVERSVALQATIRY